jgi:hypothetical protein
MARLPIQDAARKVGADQLAGDRRERQPGRGYEHRRAACVPVGAKRDVHEAIRHHHQ